MLGALSFYTCVPKTKIIWGAAPDIRRETEFFVILDHFWPFYPNNLGNQNFEKMKKTSGDVIILHMCTKNRHMMYASWDMECDRHNFLSFWAIFLPFKPLLTPKIKIWKKCFGKTLDHKQRSYDVWFLRYKAQRIFFFCHFGPFFTLWPPPLTTRKIILKKWNKLLEILSFYTCVPQMSRVSHRCWEHVGLKSIHGGSMGGSLKYCQEIPVKEFIWW